MPPRDTPQDVSSVNNVGKTLPVEPRPGSGAAQRGVIATNTTTANGETSSKLEQLLNKSRQVSAVHNVPLHTGWRRTTFHWELNAWTFGVLFLVYRYLLPESHRIWAHIALALVACDAARYYYAKGDMPGVPYTLPMVSLVAMVVHPFRFWAEMGTIAMESQQHVCTNILGGKFMIFVTDTQYCRQVMTGEGTFQIYAHPNALWLFGPRNLIYMEKEVHKAFRAILTPALFSNEALSEYARAQEAVCRRYLKMFQQQCAATKRPIDIRVSFRAMAAASSQEAFLGPYLTDELRRSLEADIQTFTMGFLCFPFPYLFGLREAIRAKDRIEAAIIAMVPLAREYVQAGHAPRCLLERWSLALLTASSDKPDLCSDDDMARTVLDFLFAAQDATNSALTYSLDVLDAHRHVLDKMRTEVDAACKTGEIWTKIRDTSSGDLDYIAKVANELLHHKPPVPMIPHLVKKPTSLAGRRIAPGTVVIPSITYSARTSGRSADFCPERPDDKDADPLFVQTVTFGAGQHKCPGRRYAESLLTVFLAVLAQDYDFCRANAHRPTVDEFIYFPTVFAADCQFVILPRADEI